MKRLLFASVTALTILGSNAATARVDVGISIGLPGIIYAQPDYYAPPIRYVEPPRVIVVPERRYYRPARVYGPRYYRERFHSHREHRHRGKSHHRDRHR